MSLTHLLVIILVCSSVLSQDDYWKTLKTALEGDSVLDNSILGDPQRNVADERAMILGRMFEEMKTNAVPTFDLATLLELLKTINIREILESLKAYNSTQCYNDTIDITIGVSERKSWALKFFDAGGKPPSGITNGAVLWPGSYDQCNSIVATINSTLGIPYSFSGKYCDSSIYADATASPVGIPVLFRIGSCLPSSCTSEEFVKLITDSLESVKQLTSLTGIYINAEGTYCHETSGSVPLSSEGIFMSILLTILTLLVIVATFFELWLNSVLASASKDEPDNVANTGVINSGMTIDEKNINGDLKDSPKTMKQMEVDNPEPTNIWRKLLLSFSLVTNITKLFNMEENPNAGTLKCLHGIRFLSMTWIILGHTYSFIVPYANNIGSFGVKSVNAWTFSVLANATLSVDTFFLISGLLTAYIFYREMNKPNGAFSSWKGWVMFYVHRYWRLTPAYLIVLGIGSSLLYYLWEGPLWYSSKGLDRNCKSYWWANALYINNLIPAKHMCMGWSWYLSNDMQFYILSPLFMVTMHYTQIGGYIVHGVIILVSIIATGVISTHNKLPPSLDGIQPGFDVIYIKPYTRIGPYIIGLMVGYLLFKTQCKIKLHGAITICCWCLAIILSLTVIYGTYDVNRKAVTVSVHTAAFYNSMHRVIWATCVGWMIFACCTGYGGWVNSLLGLKYFIPLGRLTYGAFLVHPYLIFFVYGAAEVPYVLNNLSISMIYLGNLLASYGLAFVVSMFLEAPMLGLEKTLRGG